MTPEEVLPALASVTALADKVTVCSAGSGKWVNFSLGSDMLMQLLFYRVSGSGFASVSGGKKGRKSPFIFILPQVKQGSRCKKGRLSAWSLPGWLGKGEGSREQAGRASPHPRRSQCCGGREG